MCKGDTEFKGHHCITNNLIKFAKVEPKLASMICNEANALGITYNSIPYIMSRVAQLVNNKPSKEPSSTAAGRFLLLHQQFHSLYLCLAEGQETND